MVIAFCIFFFQVGRLTNWRPNPSLIAIIPVLGTTTHCGVNAKRHHVFSLVFEMAHEQPYVWKVSPFSLTSLLVGLSGKQVKTHYDSVLSSTPILVLVCTQNSSLCYQCKSCDLTIYPPICPNVRNIGHVRWQSVRLRAVHNGLLHRKEGLLWSLVACRQQRGVSGV